MGEYALFNGSRIKIGTCEDMYYLRPDQRHLVTALSGNADPMNPDDLRTIRFRFPWPDEDGRTVDEMTSIDRYERTCALNGLSAPEDLMAEHYSVQFTAHAAGYVTSLPCPEGQPLESLKIHRNGFAGAFLLVQQGLRNGVWASIVQCGGCGLKWALRTLEDAEPAIVALCSEADRRQHQARVGPHHRNPDGTYDEEAIAYQGKWYHDLADRIATGYSVKVAA